MKMTENLVFYLQNLQEWTSCVDLPVKEEDLCNLDRVLAASGLLSRIFRGTDLLERRRTAKPGHNIQYEYRVREDFHELLPQVESLMNFANSLNAKNPKGTSGGYRKRRQE